MKLLSFCPAEGGSRIGLLSPLGVVDLSTRLMLGEASMTDVIAGWHDLRALAELHAGEGPDYSLDDIRLLAPIAHPGKILAIGLNYADHAAEAGVPLPSTQMWFSKTENSVAGPYDPIPLPRVSSQLDYEAELVIVIGKTCRHADRSAAKNAIFGYCVGNDLSVRDWQTATSQFLLGKSFDGHGPFGPWITTADAVDARSLGVRSIVNGETRQSSNTGNLVFKPVELVMHLSKAMTLKPGDILFTGTPGGVGAARNPPLYLADGDVVRIEIDELGHIEGRVVPE